MDAGALVVGSGQVRSLVFLGPSLSLREAQRLCDAEYQPPIRRGDLPRLAGPRPRRIGIIDGAFHQSLAVSPQEILNAIDAGHHFYGAASMGALRAAELAPAGMIGVGSIADAFASGAVERDDEVAVVFDPETRRALSEPLIGMRSGFRQAVGAGLLTVPEEQAALNVASGLHYPLRTYRRVFDELGLSAVRLRRLLDFLSIEAVDRKAEDARMLLRRMATDQFEPLSTPDVGGWVPPHRRMPPRTRFGAAGPALDHLPSSPKVLGWTSVRTVPTLATDAMLAGVRPRLGISRVADITGLDTLGIPNYSAIVPGLLISAFGGKSLDPAEARVGAQMEALEVALATDDRVPKRRVSYSELIRESRAVDPEALPVIATEQRDLRTVELEWVSGWDLWTGEITWVPAEVVLLAARRRPLWRTSSNGLASGNCLTEAIAHGLAEVIERDACTLQQIGTEYRHLPNLMRLLAGPPRASFPANLPEPPPLPYPFVELTSLPAPLRRAVQRVQQAGASIDLRWVASDVRVPVFVCLVHERHGATAMTYAGAGAHPDATVAARRAITEAAQTRLTHISGVREDLPFPGLSQRDDPTGDWFTADVPRVDFATFCSCAFADVADDARYMAGALREAGLKHIVVVDLSHQDIPFAVARVIVPGTEPPLAIDQRDRLSFGWRARRMFAPARTGIARDSLAPDRFPGTRELSQP